MGHHSYVNKDLLNFIEAMTEYPKEVRAFLDSPDDLESRSTGKSPWSEHLNKMHRHEETIKNFICKAVTQRLHAVIEVEPERC